RVAPPNRNYGPRRGRPGRHRRHGCVAHFPHLIDRPDLCCQSFNQFSEVGVEALTGFASAFLFTRLISLGTAVIAFSATLGAGATAQLGAMRINEEIDALEVMGIRSVAYLASTRVLAGVIVVIPLYCVSLLIGYF